MSAVKLLGGRSITALVLPDEKTAYRILALNTEKEDNLREKSLEVIRMARDLSGETAAVREADLALEFEEAPYLTLGLVYEKRGRFSGGVYHPVLKRVDRFLDRPLPKGRTVRIVAFGLTTRSSRTEPRDSGIVVETRIKAQDAVNTLLLHDREMKSIPGGEPLAPEHDGLGSFDRRRGDRKNVIDDAQESIERRLNRVPTIERDESMEDLLKHVGIRYKTLSLRQTPLDPALGVHLVRMRPPDEIHRDVRVDEDHSSTTP